MKSTPPASAWTKALLVPLLLSFTACGRHVPDPPLTVSVDSLPSSSDPLDGDVSSHVAAFTPVYATLASNTRKGSFHGVLAESWSASPDFRTWKFQFGRRIRYEDGTVVEPEHLARSWRRLAALMRRRRSSDGFLSRLEGFKKEEGPTGIRWDASSITLTFVEPNKEVLPAVSEAVYGAVSPDCFDARTLDWKCRRRAVASGPYGIAQWDDSGLELRLRRDSPEAIRHPKAPERILIRRAAAGAPPADIVFGDSLQTSPGAEFRFFGGMDAGVSFLRCQSWPDRRRPCGDRRTRRALRRAFYRELVRLGGSPALTFFPPSVIGTRPLEPDAGEAAVGGALVGSTVVVSPMDPTDRSAALVDASLKAATHALALKLASRALTAEERYAQADPGSPAFGADVVPMMTEVTLDQADSSIRYMFESAEGVRLPDPTGRAGRIIARTPVDMRSVDEVLWDDAIIWPLQHLSWGVWAHPKVDVSQANIALPVPALHWMGQGP